MKKFDLKLFVTTLSLLFNLVAYSQINGPNNVCQNQLKNYTTSTLASTYVWSANGATAVSQNGASFEVQWGQSSNGTVNLTTYDQNNVQLGSWTLPITINSKPSPTILSNFKTTCLDNPEQPKDSCFAACLNTPMLYSSPFVSGNTYAWEVIGSNNYSIVSADGNEIEVIWSNLGVNYLKLTVTNGAGCSNTYTKCVRTLETPTAIIGSVPSDSNETIRVCKNTAVFFEDRSTNATMRLWDFGDGTNSDELNPSHIFAEAGMYQVVLTARNNCYCFDRDTISVIVEATEGPEIVCPAVVCQGDTVSYYTPSSCQSFSWNAINGTIIGSSTSNTVDVVWNSQVAYIELIGNQCPSGCVQPSREKIAVITPSSTIKGPESVCQGSEVAYSLPPMPGSSYNWSVSSIGEITQRNDYEVIVKFNNQSSLSSSGTINVSYFNALLNCGGSAVLNLTKKPVFTLNTPSEVCFNDTTTIPIDEPINWMLLDSNSQVLAADSNTNNIVIPWSNYGEGVFELVVNGAASFCNTVRSSITVLPNVLAPDSIFGNYTVCQSTAYAYHVSPKSGHAVEWEIIGGTPNIASGNQITVKWDTVGPYILKVAYRELNDSKCKSAYYTKVIEPSIDGIPTILSADSVCGGDTLNFSLNFVPDNVEWTVIPNTEGSILSDRFGNNVKVQFSTKNTGFVTLRASGKVCGNEFVINKEVYLKNFSLPDIIISNDNPCPKVPVTFSTNGNNPLWTIDNQIYSINEPIVSFEEAKSVIVKLTTTNVGPGGCQVILNEARTMQVKADPIANISVQDAKMIKFCNDTTITPIVLRASLQGGTPGTNTYEWFLDSTFISNNSVLQLPLVKPWGDYWVIASSPNGCVDTSDVMQIKKDCTYLGCNNVNDDSTVTVELFWSKINCSEFYISNVVVTGATFLSIDLDFNASSSAIPTFFGPYSQGYEMPFVGVHTYIFRGFVIKGSDTLCFEKMIHVDNKTLPDFEIIREGCGIGGLTYKFLNTSTFIDVTPPYSWDFGSNSLIINGGFNPEVFFFTGNHTITLTSVAGCSISKQLTVGAPAVANFFSNPEVCQKEPVNFFNNSFGNIIQYQWDFGGKTLFDINPEVTFEDPSNPQSDYFADAKLIVTGANGCKDSTVRMISIRGNMLNGFLNKANNLPICEGDSNLISYIPITSSTNFPINYQWSDFSTGPSIQVKKTGTYQLSLTDAAGCRFVTETENVQVNTAPNNEIFGRNHYCEGEDLKLETHEFSNIETEWFVDSVLKHTGSIFIDKLAPGQYSVSINSTNTQTACATTPAPFTVTVQQAPDAPLISSSIGFPNCEGSNIQLTASPASGDYYWNTGQNGNAIYTSISGNYRAFFTDNFGCTSSNSIRINPLPDFSNFMTGCYCLPDDPTPFLPGIFNVDSFQWKKNGQLVPAPEGNYRDLTASNGLFELIAVTDSGCVDSAGVMDISVGNCSNCSMQISAFNMQCAQIRNDSVFFDFSASIDLSGDTGISYSFQPILRADGKVLHLISHQPQTLHSGLQSISGTFFIDSLSSRDTICIQVMAGNNGKVCSVETCLAMEQSACDFEPAINFNVNPFSCVLEVSPNFNNFGTCQQVEFATYTWTVNQNGSTFVSNDSLAFFDSLTAGNAQVCLEIELFNPLDSSFCTKDTCINIVVPTCSCENNCVNASSLSNEFLRFDFLGDSCTIVFKTVINNPQQQVIFPNHIGTDEGTVLAYTPLSSPFGTVAYEIQFLPNQNWSGGQTCFDLFLFDGGSNCCIPICVDLPRCDCSIDLFDLELSCAGSDKPLGWFDFSFTTHFNGTPGFNYVKELVATHLSDTVTILNYTSQAISDSTQLIEGTVSLNNMLPGDLVCFNYSALLDGVFCEATICDSLPPASCGINPSFISSFDPFTCALTLTSTSSIDSCTRVDSSDYSWTINIDGTTFFASGKEVVIYNLPQGEATVCLNVLGTNYTGTQDCHPEVCQNVQIDECICLNDCQDFGIASSTFSHFVDQGDSCILVFNLVASHSFSSYFRVNAIKSFFGDILAISTIDSTPSLITYQFEFYPNQPWGGGSACFDLFIESEQGGEDLFCCKSFCVNLPTCECDLSLSDLEISCTGPDGIPGEFLFSFNSALTAASGFNYSNGLTATHNGNPVNIDFFNPPSSQNGMQSINGKVTLSNFSESDSLCFELTAELLSKSCMAQICAKLPNDTCLITPAFTYDIDPITCVLTLNDNSFIDPCTFVDPSEYKWDININGQAFNYVGEQVVLPGLDPGMAEICYQVLGVNYTSTQDCHPNVCDEVEIPHCECSGSCDGVDLDAISFINFEPGINPCEANIEIILSNPFAQNISINGIASKDGQVIDFFSNGGTVGSPRFELKFRPNPVWQGGMVCFKLYLNVGGADCCIEICTYIPACTGSQSPPQESFLQNEPLKNNLSEKALTAFSEDLIHVYPIPAANELFVEWKEESPENVRLVLLDQSGKKVYEKTINQPKSVEKIELSDLSAGVYVLRIQQENSIFRKKVVLIQSK